MVGCSSSSDDGDATTTTTAPPGPSVPKDVGPGEAWIALDTDVVSLDVRSCADGPPASVTTDAVSKVDFVLVATGSADGDAITVTATELSSDSGDGEAQTQTVTITSGTGSALKGLLAKRSHFGQRWVDLFQPSAHEPLFERAGDRLRVTARFGPQGGEAGDTGIVDGAFVARCPAGS